MTKNQGASAEDIQYHYDLSREFYQLFLDKTMTYSSAMFGEYDDLSAAQLRKLDYHITQAEIRPGARVLDIGCGWGSLVSRVTQQINDTQCMGLTLSKDQKSFIDERQIKGVDVRLMSWTELDETMRFDAAISVGAMEHFARPGWTSETKIAAYRSFFKKVRRALKPGRCLSLQVITFDRMQAINSFITQKIFPGSTLPRPVEIMAASDRVLSLVNCRNDAQDYARTCREWAARLEASKAEAIAIAGEQRTDEYIQYLRMSAAGFEQQGFGLYRLKFRAYQ